MSYSNKKSTSYQGNNGKFINKNSTMAESIFNAFAFRNPKDVGYDGVHFINIHPQGITKLGRQLNFDYELQFTHPEATGKFKSMASFQKWIRSSTLDERIKVLTGKALYNFKTDTRNDVPNYKAVVIEAWWHQITSYNEIVKAIIDTEINDDTIKAFLRRTNYSGNINYYPFDTIYADMERKCLYRPFDLQQFNVIIEGIKHIRESLIHNDKELILPDEFYSNKSISTKEAIYGIGYTDYFDDFISNSKWDNKTLEIHDKAVVPKPYDGEIPEDMLIDDDLIAADILGLNIDLSSNQKEEKIKNESSINEDFENNYLEDTNE